MYNIYSATSVTESAKALFKEERSKMRCDGWFIARETVCNMADELSGLSKEMKAAKELEAIVNKLPLSISDNAVFAGSQSDAFARSYALINPSFRVATFSGYCDPTAVYNDIEPNEEFTEERIKRVREFSKNSSYVKALSAVYDEYDNYTKEVAFFIEQVTGHIIPDFRFILKNGVKAVIDEINDRMSAEIDEKRLENYKAFKVALNCVLVLSRRYQEIAAEKARTAEGKRKEELLHLEATLKKVPFNGCDTLFEAIQSYMLLWELMCLEQAPNPFAFSVGNADRIFEPYRAKDGMSREDAASLLKHFLVFFNVGDRSWAISQNLLISGRDVDGNDLTNETSYALMDAYFDMNLPQPILSVKLHKNTPDKVYEELGRFFFSPGVLTPSLFNDDSVFQLLSARNVKRDDLADYSVAGCQEPLIMGKDNGNTTNSWLNMPKILELCLNNGYSMITGKAIDPTEPKDDKYLLENIREIFYSTLEHYVDKMCDAANGASRAVSELPVPFLSCAMGGIKTGYDMRDTENQGTPYNGSGCLIHGLSVM
ncbi:MAG: pyruvate formate lyase family protein, partial [Clostridia bacterium]|nr:pyruvate formate lyase family protein [Clostridia bacterium]